MPIRGGAAPLCGPLELQTERVGSPGSSLQGFRVMTSPPYTTKAVRSLTSSLY